MKKILKRALIVFGVLMGLLMITGLVLYSVGRKKLTRSYPEFPVEKVNIPGDTDAITRGKHVAIIWACTKCHGTDLSGVLSSKDPISGAIPTLGTIPVSNLTAGKGGIGTYYTDEDWIRSIRHGIKPNHRPIIFMNVSTINDQDLGDLIAYIKQISPVDKEYPPVRYGPLVPIISAIGIYPPVAESIDHHSPHSLNPVPGATVEYGRYISAVCSGCHGKNIGNTFREWKQEDFIRTFHTGVLPNGKKFGQTMSSETFLELNDTELNALWLYFKGNK